MIHRVERVTQGMKEATFVSERPFETLFPAVFLLHNPAELLLNYPAKLLQIYPAEYQSKLSS
jgi:hypothetical protein